MMVGGGVHGRVAGIAHGIMIRDGGIIAASRLFMLKYLLVGGMNTETVVGGAINGMLSRYPIIKSNRIGMAGKRIDIGNNNKIGESRIYNPESDRKNRHETRIRSITMVPPSGRPAHSSCKSTRWKTRNPERCTNQRK